MASRPHTNATDARCVFVTWPGGYSAYDLRRAVPPVYSWHGSLLENKRDASGLDYKRESSEPMIKANRSMISL